MIPFYYDLPSGHPLDRSMTAEEIGVHDLRPGFDPFEYQLQDQDYGDTGDITYRLGGLMSTGPASFVYFMMNDSFLLQ